ncbi:MAG: protein kinase [Sandaracinaceae bacterium]|nr:protein kinase [Sandaracinaceae bacterium]
MKVTLTVIAGPNAGQTFTYDRRDRFLVGRSSKAQLCVSRDRYFSRHHFMVEVDPPNVFLLDLRSTNGTSVNDKKRKVHESFLADGDVIYGGDTALRVTVAGEAPRAFGAPPGAAPAALVPVTCDRCGALAPRERARGADEKVLYVCPACQDALRETPKLPSGYRFVKTLGKGSMGSVVLAEDPAGRERAIKLVMPNAALSEAARERFLADARAQIGLDHPHIVRVHEIVGGEDGVFHVVMDAVEGRGLDEVLGEGGTMPVPEALAMARAVLEALGYAHARGVVHRDLKPANVLMGQGGPWVADFGLARSYEESGASGFHYGGEDDSTRYMAPEQILDFRNVSPSADLYSVATILHRAITGQHPLPFGPDEDPFIVVLEAAPAPLASRAPGVPPSLAAAVDRGLAKDPAARFASAAEMLDALS